MKVKVITLHTVNNYGSVMQTYATQKVFENLGCSVEFIDYWRKNNTEAERARRLLESSTMRKLKPIWNMCSATRTLTEKAMQTYICLKRTPTYKFIQENIHLTKRFYSNEELKENVPQADVYVTGSDQVWNSTWNEGLELPYFLDFVPAGKKKIAFAASIGKNELDSSEIPEIKRLLQTYDFISMREKSGVDILRNIGIDAVQILDPTLMLSGDEWRRIAKYPRTQIPYLLIYQLNDNPKMDQYAEQISEMMGWDIIRLSYTRSGKKKAGKCVVLPTVSEFLGYFSSAACVLTDSFHATAFSLNLGIDFISVMPPKFGTRIESILELTETKHRLLKDYKDFSIVKTKIDKEKIVSVLDEERKKAGRLLCAALDMEKVKDGK